MSLLLSAPLVMSLLGTAAPGAVVHRCSEPDGSLVFTDRSCMSLGMSDRLPPPSSTPSRAISGRTHSRSSAMCAGSPARLRLSLSDALQAGDVNSLLGLIDWQGAGGNAARAATRRMAGIAKRESVEVTLESPDYDPYLAATDDALLRDSLPAVAHTLPPNAIRVEQRTAGGTLESVRFGLTRDLGCYWLAI